MSRNSKMYIFDRNHTSRPPYLNAPGDDEEVTTGVGGGGGGGGGFWGAIVQGVGSAIGGVGTMVASNNQKNFNDVCGAKPGIFRYKGAVKDEYNACVKAAGEAKLNAMNAQAEAKRSEKQRKAWIVPVVIVAVIAVLITSVVLIRKARKTK